MIDPIFWLGLSILLVAVSLTALLAVAIPAFQELGKAARSAEKLFDTLHRELPPTLEAIRLTGLEITELTDDMSDGVQSAGQVVKQVDQSLTDVKQQVQKANVKTRSVFAGMKAAWQTLMQPEPKPSQRSDSLPASSPAALPESTQTPQNGVPAQTELEQSLAELEAELEQHHVQLKEINHIPPNIPEPNGDANNRSEVQPARREHE